MGVDLVTYRVRIGQFIMPKKSRYRLNKLCVHQCTIKKILRLTILFAVLVTLGGDVEKNPGPGPGQVSSKSQALKQTVSYAEAARSPPSNSSTPSPSPYLEHRQEVGTRAQKTGNKDLGGVSHGREFEPTLPRNDRKAQAHEKSLTD